MKRRAGCLVAVLLAFIVLVALVAYVLAKNDHVGNGVGNAASLPPSGMSHITIAPIRV
jgi:hypothetical protein